jgi:hypothetical protein
MGHKFWLRVGRGDERVRGTAVQCVTAALQQALVGRILNQRAV